MIEPVLPARRSRRRASRPLLVSLVSIALFAHGAAPPSAWSAVASSEKERPAGSAPADRAVTDVHTASAADPSPAASAAGRLSTASGSLTGLVTVGSKLVARRISFSLYPDLTRQAPVKPVPTLDKEVRNVVVYLKPVQGAAAAVPASAPSRPLRMEQVNETFEPHVLPILRGSTVEFPNSDPFFHNVFSLSRASAFDLGHVPKGSSRSVRFDTPGVVKVFCHLHSDMSAVILVLENSLFAVPDGSARYRIDGIPPGSYDVLGWHERAKPITNRIRIEAGATTKLDLIIPLLDDSPGD